MIPDPLLLLVYVVKSVLSILLAIVVGVIFLQNFANTKTILSWRRSKFQICFRNDPQSFNNFTAFEEMSQYSTSDFTQQDSYYQNTLKSNQSLE